MAKSSTGQPFFGLPVKKMAKKLYRSSAYNENEDEWTGQRRALFDHEGGGTCVLIFFFAVGTQSTYGEERQSPERAYTSP